METNSLEKEKERRAKLPKLNAIPEGYISVAQIAEKYGVTPKHVQAKTREAKTPKLVIKHFIIEAIVMTIAFTAMLDFMRVSYEMELS